MGSRTKRQLAALLNVVKAPRRELCVETQATAMLDELIVSLQADRGSLCFSSGPGSRSLEIARDRGGTATDNVDDLAPLREVCRTGEAAVADRSLTIPLFLYERPAGALRVQRRSEAPAFGADDRTLLLLLSHQVPIGLEMTRLLAEREQLHASLQQANKMEALGALAGGLAHDFNNMLATMNMAVAVARRHASEPICEELDVIYGASKRAAQLTGRLLSFSRHQPAPASNHDVNELITVLDPMLRRIVGSSVDVVLNLSPVAGGIDIDSGAFDQSLMNLAINGRDAMRSGGTLTITTKKVVLDEAGARAKNLSGGTYVEIEVADTGEGMSSDTLARAFEPFFTTKPPGRGSGLGLAMVYAFARNAGGGIEAMSEPAQGTRIRLYLKSAERVAVRTEVSSTRRRSETRDTILVVDDDPPLRRSITRTLEHDGYRVVAAGGSAEALDAAREHGERIGLVILDMLMPGGGGAELARELDAMNLDARLLFVSGYTPSSIPHGEFLAKPFTHTDLLERVRVLMS